MDNTAATDVRVDDLRSSLAERKKKHVGVQCVTDDDDLYGLYKGVLQDRGLFDPERQHRVYTTRQTGRGAYSAKVSSPYIYMDSSLDLCVTCLMSLESCEPTRGGRGSRPAAAGAS